MCGTGPEICSCTRTLTANLYANSNGAPLLSFLRMLVMSLLRNNGYQSVHEDQQELEHDIKEMLALGGVATSALFIHF